MGFSARDLGLIVDNVAKYHKLIYIKLSDERAINIKLVLQ